LLGKGPLLHGRDWVSGRFELVLCESLTPKDGRFGNSGQLEVILWTGEVEDTKAVDVLLVLGRDSDPMDGALDIVSSEETESVTSVDGEGRVLGFDPLPLAG